MRHLNATEQRLDFIVNACQTVRRPPGFYAHLLADETSPVSDDCRPLMLRTPNRDKHIVNVSAMEGQFYRTFKSDLDFRLPRMTGHARPT